MIRKRRLSTVPGPLALLLAAMLCTQATAAEQEDESAWTVENGRPALTSRDGRFSMSFRARVQIDAALFDQADGVSVTTPLRDVEFKDLQSGAITRRFYLGVEGLAFRHFYYEYRMDFGGTRLGLTAPLVNIARVAYNTGDIANPAGPHFRFTLGILKPMFTLDDATSSASLTFLERADAVNVATGAFGGGTTRLGAELAFQRTDMFRGGDNLVIGAAVTGQNPSGNNGALPADAAHEGTQILGRAVYRPWSDGVSNVQFGMSAAHLVRIADDTALGGVRAVTLQEFPEIRVDGNRLVNTGAIRAKGGTLWGLEAAGNIRNVNISGEFYKYQVERDTGCSGCVTAPDPEFSGWYLQASWILTGENKVYLPFAVNNNMASYANPRLDAPFAFDGVHWGAWEIAARYSDLDLNWRPGVLGVPCGGGCIRGGEQKIWTLGLNWYLTNNVRMMFDYMRVDVNRLDFGGRQTGQAFNVLGTRLQFAN